MQRTGGTRRKTRSKLSKNVRAKGKIAIRRYFQNFEEGETVYFVAEPAVQKGMYHPKFHGKAGVVSKKQGSNYYVRIKDGNKEKSILIHPIHLKKV
jgi:large subunit ribosomal protein L21e